MNNLKPAEVDSAAEALFIAEQTRRQIGLISMQFPSLDMAGAYAIQAALIKRKLAASRTIIGWKIGLTSKAMQRALGIEVPDSGALFDDMLFASGVAIAQNRFIEPRVEAEIALKMAHDLPDNASREQVIAATDYVFPAIEILDTRIMRSDPDTGQRRNVIDAISDNAANAGIVAGEAQHKIDAFDLRRVGCIVSCNGVIEETGLGAGVLNDPLSGVVWLSSRLTEVGIKIHAGDIILSGSFIRPIEAGVGAQITADFGAFGIVSCTF